MEDEVVVASAVLIVLGDDLDPDLVTRTLGMEPDQQWRRGEPRRHSGRPYEWGGWKKFIPEEWKDRPIEEQLEYWATTLEGREAAADELMKLDYVLVIDCFVAAKFPLLIEIPAELQAKFAALHLNIDLHIFD